MSLRSSNIKTRLNLFNSPNTQTPYTSKLTFLISVGGSILPKTVDTDILRTCLVNKVRGMFLLSLFVSAVLTVYLV